MSPSWEFLSMTVKVCNFTTGRRASQQVIFKKIPLPNYVKTLNTSLHISEHYPGIK